MKFNIGDKVYVDSLYEGIITDIDGDFAEVEFSTGNGGGCIMIKSDTLELIPERVPMMMVSKSAHGTINVVIQNCSPEVATLLWRFDIWKSKGKYEYDDESKPNEKAKIWFECPIDFLNFIESSMGRACFERMGIQKIQID